MKCVIVLFRAVAEGHITLANTHHLDPIVVIRIDHIVGACAVSDAVFDPLDLLYLQLEAVVIRPDFHPADQASRPQSGNGTPSALNQLRGMGGQGHPQGPFITGDRNRDTVTFPVEAPDLDLWWVFLIEFIALIARLERHPESTIIIIAQYRGNTAVSVQVPNILVLPVARRILDGIERTPIRGDNAAGIITLHQGLTYIQINGVNCLCPIHPLRQLCAFVAGHDLLLDPVGFQHEVILQLHRDQCIHVGFIEIVIH